MNKNTLSALTYVFGIKKTENKRYIYIPEKDINLTVTKNNGITVIKHVGSDFKEMLLTQNNCLFPIEFCYGSLLDNELYECKNGYIAFYESYLNEYSSDYTVYFSRDYSVMEKFYNDFDNELSENEDINTMSLDEIIEKHL